MMASEYAANPILLSTRRMNEVKLAQKFARVPGGAEGHYAHGVEGAIAAYGNKEFNAF